MKVQQISIFIENRTGRLKEIAHLLGEAGINIRALSLADTSDFGILRLLVDQPQDAARVLRKNNFTMSLTEVIAVEVPDVPGGLAAVLDLLDRAKINVEYMYAFPERTIDKAVMIFRFDDIDNAVKALQQGGISMLKATALLKI